MKNAWYLTCFVLQWSYLAYGVNRSPTVELVGKTLHLALQEGKMEFHLKHAGELFDPGFNVVNVDGDGRHNELPFDISRFYRGTTASGHSGVFRIHDGVVHSGTILAEGDLLALERKEGAFVVKKFSELEDHSIMSAQPSKRCFAGKTKEEEEEERGQVGAKRQTRDNATCSIQLVADSKFVRRFESVDDVSNYMTTVFGGMSTIFARNFPGKIGMTLRGLKIYSDATTDPYLNVGGGQDEYQNLLSKVQSNVVGGAEQQACLVHLFTHRNLQGTMGVAYVGGICSPQNRGRNCGMTTTMYIDGSTSSMLRHTASFTHECGHNFGASHDGDQSPPRPDCNPPNAPFLMYFSTLSAAGSRNQFTLSPCSLQNMTTPVRTCFNVDIATMSRTVPVQFAYPATTAVSSTGPSSAAIAGIIAGVVIGTVVIAIVALAVVWKVRQRRSVVM